ELRLLGSLWRRNELFVGGDARRDRRRGLGGGVEIALASPHDVILAGSPERGRDSARHYPTAPAAVSRMSVLAGLREWRLEVDLGGRPAELALNPAAQQGERDEGGDAAELPPEVGHDEQAQAIARLWVDARPDVGGQ